MPDLKVFCSAYDVWLSALVAAGKHSMADDLRTARLYIVKSNLLDRLVYGGEPLRTRMCPKHKGKWSGLPSPGNDCECDLTGWLPEPKETA
jgi:hypothetical protein